MVVSEEVHLPSDEELTVQEVNLSGPVLKSGAFHLGKACEFENNEFMLCRKELEDPRACINEGKAVTSCALNFFRNVKNSCYDEFMQYTRCIDKSSVDQQFYPCRKTQAVFDKCAYDKLKIRRPPHDYFTRVQVHKTSRPRPPADNEPATYPDATPYLPEDTPKPPAKHGSRYIFFW